MFVCFVCKYKNYKYLNISIYECDINIKKDIYKKKDLQIGIKKNYDLIQMNLLNIIYIIYDLNCYI